MINSSFSELAKRNIAIKIDNRNQEKAFIHLCRKNNIPLQQKSKDFTMYRNGKPIFPVYYGFDYYDGIVCNWNTTDASLAKKKKPIILDVHNFEMNLEEAI